MPLLRSILILSLAVLFGCAGPPPAKLTPVTGKITLDDKALAGAKVVFFPTGTTQGHGGSAITGDDGQYEILAHRQENRKGLMAGEYKVFVSRLVTQDGKPLPRDVPAQEGKESVPEPYCQRDESPLTATIDDDAKPRNFNLKSP